MFIGTILKEARLDNKLSLQELSMISNISISTLRKIENNYIRNIKNMYLYRLSKILNINYNDLLRLKWDILPTFFYERNSTFAGK